MFGALGFFDSRLRPTDRALLERLEAKVDLLIAHMGLESTDTSNPAALSDEVKKLAAQPRKKFEAVKLHRAQTGADLSSAHHAVQTYISSLRS